MRIDEKMTSADLKAALESNAARIIVTTLQKFPVVAAYLTDDGGAVVGKRFAVIIDEAHSSTSGEAMKDLKGVLGAAGDEGTVLAAQEAREAAVEDAQRDVADDAGRVHDGAGGRNLSFYAFTATQAEDAGTVRHPPRSRTGSEPTPFHTYAMRQAIDEKFILDVLANYTIYDTYYRLANSTPDDPEVPVSKGVGSAGRYVAASVESGAEGRDHRRALPIRRPPPRSAGGQGDGRDPVAAARGQYKKAIDAYIASEGLRRRHASAADPGGVLPARSSTPLRPDRHLRRGGDEQDEGIELPEKFDGDDYQVLVVAEKYQTGFDQPLLHHVRGQKVAGVKAVQTLSPAQPGPPREGHVHPRLRQRPGRHPDAFRPSTKKPQPPHRPQRAVCHAHHPHRVRGAPPARDGQGGQGVAVRAVRQTAHGVREPATGIRPLHRTGGRRPGHVP